MGRTRVQVAFDEPELSSDGGSLLIGKAAEINGYEDANDCDTLKDDVAFKLAVGRRPHAADHDPSREQCGVPRSHSSVRRPLRRIPPDAVPQLTTGNLRSSTAWKPMTSANVPGAGNQRPTEENHGYSDYSFHRRSSRVVRY